MLVYTFTPLQLRLNICTFYPYIFKQYAELVISLNIKIIKTYKNKKLCYAQIKHSVKIVKLDTNV